MRVYVAGPMTGKPSYNYEAFMEAGRRIIADGHDPLTPFEANSKVWHKHYGRPFDPHTDKCDYGDPILREMMTEDLLLLFSADAIALLPGWEKSKGATMELAVAKALGIKVYDAETLTASVAA